MRTRRVLVASLPCLLLAVTVHARTVHLHKPARGQQVRMSPFTIPPSGEREVCEYRRLANRKTVDAQEFKFAASPGTHHIAVWAYFGEDRDPSNFPSKPTDSVGCNGFGPADSYNKSTLAGSGRGGSYAVRFPEGIALRLAPHQPVFLNAHYRNGTPDVMRPEIVFNVTPARRGTVRHHAESLTVGNYSIDIPPHSVATLVSEWHAPIDLNVIELASHQHKRGTRFTIERLEGGASTGPIYESTNWETPLELWPDEPMRVRAGDGFRFTCEWKNDDDYPVHFGVTTNDEMCFVTGYYYRDDESATLPAFPRCFPQDEGLLCGATTVR
jgi:hypothetical protein